MRGILLPKSLLDKEKNASNTTGTTLSVCFVFLVIRIVFVMGHIIS